MSELFFVMMQQGLKDVQQIFGVGSLSAICFQVCPLFLLQKNGQFVTEYVTSQVFLLKLRLSLEDI